MTQSRREAKVAVNTLDELRTVYRPPAPRAGLKVLDRLDDHCRRFLSLSPFYVHQFGTRRRAGRRLPARCSGPGFLDKWTA